MKKKIAIIGGGISGLSVLHYLKKYYGDDEAEILLLEKNAQLGGTASTKYHPEYEFEEGPSGFLDSRESIRDLIRELGAEPELIRADIKAKSRYISVGNRLINLPTGPLSLFAFPKLSVIDKMRLFREPSVPSGTFPNETVYRFAHRRLGKNFADYLIDPMVTGIFGGQADQLVLRYAFPRMYELEQTHGSLIKAMIAAKKEGRSTEKAAGEPKGTLMSLKRGMFQLTEILYEKYGSSIRAVTPALSLMRNDRSWQIQIPHDRYLEADEVFVCTPAYVSAELLRRQNSDLSQALKNILYAPIAVVGCLFRKAEIGTVPPGFGYLVPSSENKDVLGVLFDTHIFPDRTQDDYFLFRLMIGGSRKPLAAIKTEEELGLIARKELEVTLGITAAPVNTDIKIWPKAIPQYDANYVKSLETINKSLASVPALHLVSNYIGGISLNDCAKNAREAVEQSLKVSR